MAILIIAIPFMMQKEFKRREMGQNQAISHKIRQLGATALAYMRDRPTLNDGITVLQDSQLLSALKPYGLSSHFKTTDKFNQKYEVHIKQEADENQNKELAGFVVVYLADGLSEKISFLRRRKMAEAIGAMGGILEEDGEIINSAGIWKMTQEEWGFTLPPFSILMALQENDVNYTFLSRFKIDDLGQGNTFLVDLNMGGKDIKNANMIYTKEVDVKNLIIKNLAVLETINTPNAQFNSITVNTITEDAFKINGNLTTDIIETKEIELMTAETNTLNFTKATSGDLLGQITLTMEGKEEIDDDIELKIDNSLAFISSACRSIEEEPVCRNNDGECCIDRAGNTIMNPSSLSWNEEHSLVINSAVRGLNDEQNKLYAHLEAPIINTSKIYFGEKTESGEYPYLLDLSGTQSFVNDIFVETKNFAEETSMPSEEPLLNIIKHVYGVGNADGLYLKLLAYINGKINE